MTAWEILTQLKATLAAVPGIASCAVGLKANITPGDYPLIRIVPTRLTPKDEVGDRALLELTVYFGDALLESADGLAEVYEGLFDLGGSHSASGGLRRAQGRLGGRQPDVGALHRHAVRRGPAAALQDDGEPV